VTWIAAGAGGLAGLWQAGTVAGFDELVTQALTAPFSGWDFSWLDRRSWTEPLPWDYSARIAALARKARTMLDMGTGGGEALSRLPHRAPRTVATEAWPPNVGLAARRLLPLGIPVIQSEQRPTTWTRTPLTRAAACRSATARWT
jgi:hypothetical protein